MPHLTQPAVNRWVEMAIADCANRRHNMVIEGTMRDPEVPLKTAAYLRERGYRVEMHVLAVHPQVSSLNTLDRYQVEKAFHVKPRFTHPDDHQNAVDGLPRSLQAIERAMAADYLALYRHGLEKIYSNERIEGEWEKAPRATQVILDERSRPLTSREADELLERAHGMLHLLHRQGRPVTVLEDDTFRAHIRIAENLHAAAQKTPAPPKLSTGETKARIFEAFASRDGLAAAPSLRDAYEVLASLRKLARANAGTARDEIVDQGQTRLAEEIARGRRLIPLQIVKPPQKPRGPER